MPPPRKALVSKDFRKLVRERGQYSFAKQTYKNLTSYRLNVLTTSKKAAFTLAEVLITLGIIGVVAAITMPTVINNYKNKETVTKLKKAYSTLNQAFRMSESVNEASEYWENSFDMGAEAYYNKYWKPFFNNPTLCLTYKECGYSTPMPITYLNGSKYDTMFDVSGSGNTRIMFYLNDGTLYTIITMVGSGIPCYEVYIDINGGKKPNMLGKDVFLFKRVEGKGILPYGYDASSTDVENSCKKGGSGLPCAARIMNDGWEIKY